MKSIRKEAHEWKISTRHAVTSKALTLRVTACGRKVMMSILGLVWQESMRAVAAMSKKTTVKSDFTRFLFHSKKENHQLLDIICISISRITIMSF